MEYNNKLFTIRRTVSETKVFESDVLAKSKDVVEKEIADNNEKYSQVEGVNYPRIGYEGAQPCCTQDLGKVIAKNTSYEVIEK